MGPETTTSASVLRLFAEALDDLGVDSLAVLRRCDIDPAWLEDPEVRIPSGSMSHVWVAAAEVASDPCVGLHAGSRIHPRAVNVFGYLLLSSATIGDGLRRVAHYQRVLTQIPWLSFDEDGDALRLRVGMLLDDPEARAIHAEYVAPLTLEMTGWVSETRIDPVEAAFEHEPRGDPAEYRRVLRCPVKFGAERSEIVLAAETLARPSVHANPRLERLHEDFAESLLSRLQRDDVASRVRRALAERLESGPLELAAVARHLGMSGRSLQRRLEDADTSFRGCLEDLRRDLAREHLERHDTPIAEIAYLTGFSEVSAFTRAARRWFGRTPAAHRREAASRRRVSAT